MERKRGDLSLNRCTLSQKPWTLSQKPWTLSQKPWTMSQKNLHHPSILPRTLVDLYDAVGVDVDDLGLMPRRARRLWSVHVLVAV